MGKIISQTLEVETIHEPVQKPETVYYVEVCNVDVNTRVVGPTSMGYDNEIGLWEELEHRKMLVNRAESPD